MAIGEPPSGSSRCCASADGPGIASAVAAPSSCCCCCCACCCSNRLLSNLLCTGDSSDLAADGRLLADSGGLPDALGPSGDLPCGSAWALKALGLLHTAGSRAGLLGSMLLGRFGCKGAIVRFTSAVASRSKMSCVSDNISTCWVAWYLALERVYNHASGYAGKCAVRTQQRQPGQ